MNRKASFVKALAEQLATNAWQEPEMIKSIYWLLDHRPTWVAPLVNRILTRFDLSKTDPCTVLLGQFIDQDPGFQETWRQHRQTLRIKRYNLEPLASKTSGIDCEQPCIQNVAQLALWLGLSHGRLKNYSQHWSERNSKFYHRYHHYYYQWRIQKGGKKRLIEAPKERLADVQRQIYLGILNRIPLHASCCGFRKGYSRINFVTPHVGKQVVIKMDLLNFFTSIPLRRIHALFVTLGYSHHVSGRLAGLCCNQTPRSVICLNTQLTWNQRQQLARPHVPQGSSSSPALANLCAFNLDVRLSALAEKFGADYSRYADDLAFSGDYDLSRNTEKLTTWVAYIATSEGFSINHRKTRIMRRSISQRLTGIVINQFPNYSRKHYDRLKAILHNCVKYGPESQNLKRHPAFRAHLLGRIAEVRSLNPMRFTKLANLYDQIRW